MSFVSALSVSDAHFFALNTPPEVNGTLFFMNQSFMHLGRFPACTFLLCYGLGQFTRKNRLSAAVPRHGPVRRGRSKLTAKHSGL